MGLYPQTDNLFAVDHEARAFPDLRREIVSDTHRVRPVRSRQDRRRCC